MLSLQLGLCERSIAPWGSALVTIKRTFDFTAASALIVVLLPFFVLIAVLIKATSKGPVIHWSRRIGKDNQVFRMPKFRSMRVVTPQVATHLMTDSSAHLTPIGGFLRRTSFDELPQLFSILTGELSFVGPRPALFNQCDLAALRTECGVHRLVPGLTGWAQINGRDRLTVPVKVQFDLEYLRRRSFRMDLQILCKTVVKVLRQDDIRH